jgi:nucleoside-diphosphate-sugar epimerase
VSGEAELNFEKGYTVNLDGSYNLLEAIRRQPDYCPKLVTASSIAVYGTPFDDPIIDDFQLTPLTSYGTQTAIGELLMADYSRKGFVDGVGLRLPTLVVRPGRPNGAASSFFSGIIREPLAGEEAILPVSPDVVHWLASPRSAVGFFRHAADLDTTALGARRSMVMPGLAISVGEMLESLRRIAGEKAFALVKAQPDEMVQAIVAGWPRVFEAKRAASFGFTAETDFDQIVNIYIEDELNGQIR